ncbi:hypothetical protein ACTFIU_010365 [Dictyostelium citrinum]
MINKISSFKILLLLFIVIISLICAQDEDLISTPEGYYDLKRYKRFPHYKNIQPNDETEDTDLYYPDVCKDAIGNRDGALSFVWRYFPGSTGVFETLLVTKGTNMTMDVSVFNSRFWGILVLCIEGNLTLTGFSDLFPMPVHALVVLPGGSLTSNGNAIVFWDTYQVEETDKELLESKLKGRDPFNFFPGLLVLGGTLNLIGNSQLIYNVERVSDTSLRLSTPFSNLKYQIGYYKITIFTDSNPQGVDCSFTMDSDQRTLNLFSCIPLLDKDKVMKAFISLNHPDEYFGNIVTVFKEKGVFETTNEASIFITGDSNVYIENFEFKNLGKTKNHPYNDTKLIFSPNDRNSVTEIIEGSNQRFRGSLYIEFSNNVTIKNCVIRESLETRSPLVFFGSNVFLSDNIISSKSGSSLIAQYGTENIQSSNNFYFQQGASYQSTSQQKSIINMDFGNEGNGIYSISPNILSSQDLFIGQKYSINFNFITNRSMITGFNQDCYAPCFNDSIIFQKNNKFQYPVDFKIFNPKFLPTNTTNSDWYILNINDNGKLPGTYYTVNHLTTSDPIHFTLDNSVLSFSDLESSENFKMNGNAKRLDIVNSIIGPTALTNQQLHQQQTIISNVSSSDINFRNSYVYSKQGQQIIPIDNQIYGSSIIPFYYNDSDILNQVKILSVFPDIPYQIVAGYILNVSVNLQIISLADISCIFSSSDNSLFNSTTILANPTDRACVLPLVVEKEGNLDLEVTLKISLSKDYYYTFGFPNITVYKEYFFYSGWVMIDSSTGDEFLFDGNLFKSGCQQQVSSNCTLSTNSKFITGLPNVTGSDELNTLFSSGITSINPYEPVTITIPIDKESKKNQIQLFFTHQPIDIETSLLSIYVENQPIFLLEPLQSNLDSTFKNLTFHYENSKSLEKINISFTTRGDIHLTSMAVYSSFDPIVITPTTTPTLTPSTSTSTPILTTTTTSIITTTPTTPKTTSNNNNKLKIALPICLFALLVGVGVLACFVFRKKKKNQRLDNNIDDGGEMSSIKIKKEYYNSFDKIKELTVFKKEDFKNYSNPKESTVYSISDPLLNFIGSDFLNYSDPNFPLSFSKNILEFGLNGSKCDMNTTLSDFLQITNSSNIRLSINIALPSNDSGEVHVGLDSFELNPSESKELEFSLKLNCTTRFFERFAIEAKHTHSFKSIHTHLFIHVESKISSRLDIKEIEIKELISQNNFSTVNIANYRGLQVVVRKIKIHSANYTNSYTQTIKKFYSEMDILSKLKNKNIVSFIGCTHDSSHLWIVMEYAPLGSLCSLIYQKKEKLSLIQKVKLMLDTTKGCEFLHSNDIINCNIKPNNLLLFSTIEKDDVCVKISDFGIKKFEKDDCFTKDSFKDEKDQKVMDVFEFGITLYETMIEETLDLNLSNLILEGKGPTLELDKLDEDLRNIVERCWNQNENQRPTFSKITILLKEKYTKLLKKKELIQDI